MNPVEPAASAAEKTTDAPRRRSQRVEADGHPRTPELAVLTAAADSDDTTPSRVQLALALVRTIRSPESGLAGQGVRFALAGTIVAGVYVGVTTVLHSLFAVPFQLALAIGFVVSVALHFTLQRLFVWRYHEQFALEMRHQAARYLLVCATQYGVTALSTARLPGLLGLPVEVVYVMTMLTVAGINFVLFRGSVFHPGSPYELPDA